jgi:hypothetical protein
MGASRLVEGPVVFLSADQSPISKEVSMTRAEEVHTRVEALVASGIERADAFKQAAEELGIAVNSVRGSYYQWQRKQNGDAPSTRTRRRETTPDDALADARKALERAIESIDREVEVAKARADEAKAEYDALRASASERKAAITQRLEALK